MALDLNIEAEAIMSYRSRFDLEMECVSEITVVSRDSVIPHHTNRSYDLGTNTKGVSVAQLPRNNRKRRVG